MSATAEPVTEPENTRGQTKTKRKRAKSKSRAPNPEVEAAANDWEDPEGGEGTCGNRDPEVPSPAGSDDNDDAPPAGPSASADTGSVRREMRRPPGRPRKEPKDPAAGAQDLPDAPEIKTASAGTLKKLGHVIGRKMPGAEHIEVNKRTETGKLGYVGTFDAADLAESQSMHSFLDQYVRPQFGPGAYQLFGVAADGKKYDCGVVHLLPRADDNVRGRGGDSRERGPDPSERIVDLLARQLDRRDRDRSTTPTPALDPIETAERLHSLTEKISSSGKGDMGAIATLVSEQGRLMLQAMQRSEERTMQIIERMGQKEHDPLMLALLDKLLTKEKSEPMPPPPPPPDPTASLRNLAEVMIAMQPKQPDMTQFFEMMMRRSEGERLSMREVLDLINEKRSQPGTDDFRTSLDNLSMVFEHMGRLRQATEPGPGGFWDAIGGLLSHRELASSIASALRVRSGQRPVTQYRPQLGQGTPPQQPQAAASLPADLRERTVELHRRRLEIEERKLAEEEARLNGTAAPAPAPSSAGAAPEPPRSGPVVPPAASNEPVVDQELIARVRERHGGKIPPLPPNIDVKVNAFIESADDEQIIEAAVGLVCYLMEFEDWRPYGAAVLQYVHAGDVEQSFAFLEGLMKGLGGLGFMQPELVDHALRALAENYETFIAKLEQGAEDLQAADGDEEEDESEESTPS